MEKPVFNADQLTTASDAAKTFGNLRKKAKKQPQFITDNGKVDTVVLEYGYFEEMYARLKELELHEEDRILSERIARLDNEPDSAVSWKDIKRT